jgi:hypothetical protein
LNHIGLSVKYYYYPPIKQTATTHTHQTNEVSINWPLTATIVIVTSDACMSSLG